MTIPSKDLIGKNARVVNGVYLDDFMDALNNYATVNNVFGKNRSKIAKGYANEVNQFVLDTLGHFGYEYQLVSLVMTAAKNNSWRAIAREQHQEYGLDVVVEKNFGHVIEHKGQKYLLPSVKYLEHCKKQK
jgi:hypothetical protein